MRAKLYPTERVVGSFKCNKPRCLVCVIITETNIFTSTVTGKTYKINHKFDCDENCLVYLLTCKHCGVQYVRQTVADFRYRWNNYKDNCRKHSCNDDCMKKHLYDHYLSCNKDFLNTVSVTFIDKTEPSDQSFFQSAATLTGFYCRNLNLMIRPYEKCLIRYT